MTSVLGLHGFANTYGDYFAVVAVVATGLVALVVLVSARRKWALSSQQQKVRLGLGSAAVVLATAALGALSTTWVLSQQVFVVNEDPCACQYPIKSGKTDPSH